MGGAAATPRVRLLLDEMYPAAIAEALRAEGYDVVAVQEEEVGLRRLSDPLLFAAAQEVGRAVVTENIKDFAPLAATSDTDNHHGLVFTTNRTFPRHRSAFIGAMVLSLRVFMQAHPDGEARSLVHWLQPHRETS